MQCRRTAWCVLAVVASGTIPGLKANARGGDAKRGTGFMFSLYRRESGFVRTPASAGALVGAVSGFAVSAVVSSPLLPVDENAWLVPVVVTTFACGISASMVTGAPFYVTEKLTWDFPKGVIALARRRGRPRQADPRKADSGDNTSMIQQ